jgi:hypothetical protein
MMRPLVLLAAACLLATVLASCGTGATTNCKVPPDRALLQAVRAHAGPIVLPTAKRRGNAGRLTITACQTSPTDATATLTVFSLSDKNTRDIRHGMKLERRAGKWIVVGDAHSRRCQHGRTQEFSSAPCPARR